VADHIILAHGEHEKQLVFAEKVKEIYQKNVIIPELGEKIVVTGEGLATYPADRYWFAAKQKAVHTDLKPETAEENKDVSIKPLEKKQVKKANRTQVRQAYDRLTRRLEQLIEHGHMRT
jgi:hypothetical protein